MKPHERIIVALDVDSPRKALALVEQLKDHVGAFEIGTEFITSMLASIVPSVSASAFDANQNFLDIRELFVALDKKIFWDGKLHDIPNTVGKTSLAIRRIGVKMFNLHASAGREAIQKAVANRGNALVLGVTVLTSIDEDACVDIYGDTIADTAMGFAKMLSEEGADGIICAPGDLAYLNQEPKIEKMIKVCPNVRPAWVQKKDDQNKKRQMTPGEAVTAGATYLVMGRPITQPPEGYGPPVEAAKRIALEIDKAVNLPKGGK